MFDKYIDKDPWNLEYVPNHLKTKEMYGKSVDS